MKKQSVSFLIKTKYVFLLFFCSCLSAAASPPQILIKLAYCRIPESSLQKIDPYSADDIILHLSDANLIQTISSPSFRFGPAQDAYTDGIHYELSAQLKDRDNISLAVSLRPSDPNIPPVNTTQSVSIHAPSIIAPSISTSRVSKKHFVLLAQAWTLDTNTPVSPRHVTSASTDPTGSFLIHPQLSLPSDFEFTACCTDVNEFTVIPKDQWVEHWYYLSFSILHKSQPVCDETVSFICMREWPAPGSGIMLKAAPFDYKKDRIFRLRLNNPEHIPGPQQASQHSDMPQLPVITFVEWIRNPLPSDLVANFPTPSAVMSTDNLIRNLAIRDKHNCFANTACGYLVAERDAAVPALTQALISPTHERIRYYSAHCLADINTPTSRVPLILAAAQDTNDGRNAAYCLTWHPARDAEDVYIKLLSDQNRGNVGAAINALNKIKSTKARPHLQAILQNPRAWHLYYRSLVALRNIEDRPLAKPLTEALDIMDKARYSPNPDPNLLNNAAETISRNIEIALPDVMNLYLKPRFKAQEYKHNPNIVSIIKTAGPLAYPYIRIIANDNELNWRAATLIHDLGLDSIAEKEFGITPRRNFPPSGGMPPGFMPPATPGMGMPSGDH